jgi:hypothetical protein
VRILDALLALQSRYDGQVRERVYEQAKRQGCAPDEAHLVAVAAMVVDAARQTPQAEDRAVTEPVDASRLPTSAFSDTGELVRLSKVLGRSPGAGATREGTVRASHG